MAELPELVQLHEEWKDKGVRVQTVSIDVIVPRGSVDTAVEVQQFLEKRELALPTVVYTGDAQQLFQEWNLKSTPLTVLLDSGGNVVERVSGRVGKDRLEQLISKALAE